MYRPNIYIAAKFCSRIGCSYISSSYLSYQIVFAKFNLMISYGPPYSREVWHYREANTDLIRRAISNFNWEKAFYNTDVTKKVSIFNKTILNVLSNYKP